MPSRRLEAALPCRPWAACAGEWPWSARPRRAASGLFRVLYGAARTLGETWRIPDAHIGYLTGGWLTMGQLLSFPMVIAGVALLVVAYRRNEPSGNLAPAR